MARNVNEKLPSECTNITEVRNEIDNIDREIINLLSDRAKYVHEVVKYKDNTVSSIQASDRHAVVIDTRREWAEAGGLNPDVVEQVYETLINYFIDEERKLKNL